MDGRLARRIHLGAGLHDVAHDHGLDFVGAKTGPGHRGGNRRRTEIGRRHILKGAAKGADRGADRFGENHGVLRCRVLGCHDGAPEHIGVYAPI
jgi:hypothetical protein